MKNVPENELFSAYLDGELTADQQADVERLLASSPAARQLMDELRALSSTLQSMPVRKLPEDLTDQILRTAERRMLAGKEAPETPFLAVPSGEGINVTPPASPWKGLGRRLLTPRNLFWPGMAVAVALMLMLFGDRINRVNPRQPAGAHREVAMAPDATADHREPEKDQLGGEIPTIRARNDATPMNAKAEVAPAMVAEGSADRNTDAEDKTGSRKQLKRSARLAAGEPRAATGPESEMGLATRAMPMDKVALEQQGNGVVEKPVAPPVPVAKSAGGAPPARMFAQGMAGGGGAGREAAG